MKIEEFISDKDHEAKVNSVFIEEITRLMELYMVLIFLFQLAVELL